jgi:hypothetical protein
MLPCNEERDISRSKEEIDLWISGLKGRSIIMVKIKIYSNRPAGKR